MSLTSKLVVASALALGTAPAVALAETRAPIVEVQKSVEKDVQNDQAPTPAQDTSDYAQREAQDKQVQNYQGGSTVVIGISGGALLVLLFLLLIL